ncbi:2-deoxy-5-keto-D-gluconate 6-phosphate aldolase domain-containing protein [Streptomyces sp. NPDC006645]|uniref:2-deoxy-5-keto-D-gluconate 6-phosphate aldolase domain-containing protein n=1 Tax=unclassified Streptomyces TaxID=2593676 RepID=UPI0033B055C0
MTDIPLAGPENSPQAVSDEQPLLILAADHRNSLESGLYGLTRPPDPAQAARISADKLLIYQALLDAAEELPETVQPGILIDEQYGAGVIELAGRSGGAVDLSVPVEASGSEWFEFAYGGRWRRHAEFFPADHAKVLVRDNPGFDADRRAQQARDLAEVSSWAADAGRPLILELLVPASDDDKRAVGDDTARYDAARYDAERRPGLTVEVIEYLQDRGVEPAIWKIEGLERHEDSVAVLAAAQRDGRSARCIVLGRHATHGQLDHWLAVAAPVPGFVGFAIGRSIWWDALHAHLRHGSTGKETRRRITGQYLDFARYYLKARGTPWRGSQSPARRRAPG